MEIINVLIGDLKEAEYNPRMATEDDYNQLKASIEKFGLVDPIIVNKRKDRMNTVIGGHFRLRVAKDLGMKVVPVFYVDLNEEQEKELNVRLNKNVGRWDFDLLSANFDVDDLMSYGFTQGELGLSTTDGKDQIDRDKSMLDHDMDTYLDGNIRQIVLYFKKEQFDQIIPRMDNLMKDMDVPNHTEVFLKLLEHYENSGGKSKKS